MIAIRGVNVCGCPTTEFEENPDTRICGRCRLPYSVMTAAYHRKRRDNPPEPTMNLCGEIFMP